MYTEIRCLHTYSCRHISLLTGYYACFVCMHLWVYRAARCSLDCCVELVFSQNMKYSVSQLHLFSERSSRNFTCSTFQYAFSFPMHSLIVSSCIISDIYIHTHTMYKHTYVVYGNFVVRCIHTYSCRKQAYPSSLLTDQYACFFCMYSHCDIVPQYTHTYMCILWAI